jgi:hypothetical protein
MSPSHALEVVEDVVGATTSQPKLLGPADRVEALRRVRQYLLDCNYEIESTIADSRHVNCRLAILSGVITEQERNKTSSRTAPPVWVPPSSSVYNSKHSKKHGNRRQSERTSDVLGKAKLEYQLLVEEREVLRLKRAMLIWRMMTAMHREMGTMLDSLDGQQMLGTLGRAFKGWKEVSNPWGYDAHVVQQVQLFRQLSQMSLLDQIFHYWRETTIRRRELLRRQEWYRDYLNQRLLKAAMAQWKVFRVVHHLDATRMYFATEFDSIRLLKMSFSYWKARISRRLAITNRMNASIFGPRIHVSSSVDALLLLGTGCHSLGVSLMLQSRIDDFSVLQDGIVRLKAASVDMCPRVRWRGVEVEDAQQISAYDPEKYLDFGYGGDASNESLDIIVSLMRCREEHEILCHEREEVKKDVECLKQNIPDLQTAQMRALHNLEECKQAVLDMNNVKERMAKELREALTLEQSRQQALYETIETANHLKITYQSITESLEASRMNLKSCSDDIAKMEEEIKHWKNKVHQHAKSAAIKKSKHVELTHAVKLQEAQDRLKQITTRREDRQKELPHLRKTLQEASISEREMRMEVDRAHAITEHAHGASEASKKKVHELQSHIAALEKDYNDLVICLEETINSADECGDNVGNTLAKISVLDKSQHALEAQIKRKQKDIDSLEKALEKVQEEERRLKNDAINLNQIQDMTQYPNVEIVWQQAPQQSHQVGTLQHRPIPGDMMLLQSARSYNVLRTAKICLSYWRQTATSLRKIHEGANARFLAHVAPAPFSAWRMFAQEQQSFLAMCNSHRMTRTFFGAWKRLYARNRSNKKIVMDMAVQSSLKTKSAILHGWVAYTRNSIKASDFSCRRLNRLKCSIFHYWRLKTAISTRLELLLIDFTTKKEAETLHKALHTWKNGAQHRALLKRVFSNACDAWSIRLAEEKYFSAPSVKRLCFSAWSVFMHQSREQRRLQHIHGLLEAAYKIVYIRKKSKSVIAFFKTGF